MTIVRTSHTHPLQIAEVKAHSKYGRIGITFCPGKHDRLAITGIWERNLDVDLDTIKAWGAHTVVTLLESSEMFELKVLKLGEEVTRRGMSWCHLPIADYSIPNAEFEKNWLTEGKQIRQLLRQGESVLIHCKGGLGRAGMIAARLLVELGVDGKQAIRTVRKERRGAIETQAQISLIHRTQPILNDDSDIQLPPPMDINTLERVGGQMGTNPAGIFQSSQGQRYYVKVLESPMQARNEWLAAKLYELARAPTLTYVASKDPCQVITEWVDLDKKCIAHFNLSEFKQAQQWLAVHAWTANWDAVGYSGDNQGSVNGSVLTLDVGGALAFRAHGDPKGKAFGFYVEELNTLREDRNNPHALKLFAGMSKREITQSIEKVTSIPDHRIREVIIQNGGSEQLSTKMIARKADMLKRLVLLLSR
ncbi:cyclin-dependent kinase inhibitor 3 family protein [Vibrio sp. YIC-376]|uniref:cyclin-dependent kinase inhibitor 3 family protein n=1 Tax=Vibrio sp. YIC-376 TaxID=3136162 RepID=UPI00402A7DFF